MIKRSFKKIIIILILSILLFPYGICFALEVSEAGQIVASFAESFCNNAGSDVIYENGSDRQYGYLLKLRSGTAEYTDESGNSLKNGEGKSKVEYSKRYPMDEATFVSSMYHNSLGIGAESSLTIFINPGSESSSTYFEEITDAGNKPGDILIKGNEILIYLGPNKVADCTLAHNVKIYSKNLSGFKTYRIKQSIVKDINKENCVTEFKKNNATESQVQSKVQNQNLDKAKFYYSGTTDGTYSVTKGNIFKWIINAIKEIFAFLVNGLMYLLRMIFVGWTFLIEKLITNIIQSIANTDEILDIDATDYGENGNKHTDSLVTIEKIIYDEVKVFDVNFFNIEE